jgi:5'-nucleotidase
MRILLTNDDGIASDGVQLLAVALREAGHHVFLIAPDSNRSGSSHSITFLSDPCKLIQIDKDSWSCRGTPVDCIIVGLLGGLSEEQVDLVLSGINLGANLGTDIVYSGTAAAARQGSLMGIPSVALSLVENDLDWQWQSVIPYIVENLVEFKSYWQPGIFVNINFPNIREKPKAILPAFPAKRYYNDRIVNYTAPGGKTYCFADVGNVDKTPEAGSDWAVVLAHNAAYSLIHCQPAAL